MTAAGRGGHGGTVCHADTRLRHGAAAAQAAGSGAAPRSQRGVRLLLETEPYGGDQERERLGVADQGAGGGGRDRSGQGDASLGRDAEGDLLPYRTTTPWLDDSARSWGTQWAGISS